MLTTAWLRSAASPVKSGSWRTDARTARCGRAATVVRGCNTCRNGGRAVVRDLGDRRRRPCPLVPHGDDADHETHEEQDDDFQHAAHLMDPSKESDDLVSREIATNLVRRS